MGISMIMPWPSDSLRLLTNLPPSLSRQGIVHRLRLLTPWLLLFKPSYLWSLASTTIRSNRLSHIRILLLTLVPSVVVEVAEATMLLLPPPQQLLLRRRKWMLSMVEWICSVGVQTTKLMLMVYVEEARRAFGLYFMSLRRFPI